MPGGPNKRPSNHTFPLRLPRSLRTAAEAVSRQEGVSLNHFIALAVAEKLARLDRPKPPSRPDLDCDEDKD